MDQKTLFFLGYSYSIYTPIFTGMFAVLLGWAMLHAYKQLNLLKSKPACLWTNLFALHFHTWTQKLWIFDFFRKKNKVSQKWNKKRCFFVCVFFQEKKGILGRHTRGVLGR